MQYNTNTNTNININININNIIRTQSQLDDINKNDE
jgi:hypothetical protein